MIGSSFTSVMVIAEAQTAIAMGSGDLPVLATPAMIALMENAAMNCVAPRLPKGATTVGGLINVTHLKPASIGVVVQAKAIVTSVEGKKIEFEVSAHCGDVLLGKGTHVRYIVDKQKFMFKI